MPQAYSSLGAQWLMRGHRFNPVLWDAVIEVGNALSRQHCIHGLQRVRSNNDAPCAPFAVQMISEEVDRSPAQVILKWALQSGMVGRTMRLKALESGSAALFLPAESSSCCTSR